MSPLLGLLGLEEGPPYFIVGAISSPRSYGSVPHDTPSSTMESSVDLPSAYSLVTLPLPLAPHPVVSLLPPWRGPAGPAIIVMPPHSRQESGSSLLTPHASASSLWYVPLPAQATPSPLSDHLRRVDPHASASSPQVTREPSRALLRQAQLADPCTPASSLCT